MKKARRIKWKIGDIFYFPLENNAKFAVLDAEGDGEYLPSEKDRVAFGQIIQPNPMGFLRVALLDYSSTQKEVHNANLEEVLETEVYAILETTDSFIKRGWAPIVGNRLVREDMPYQACIASRSRKFISDSLANTKPLNEKDLRINKLEFGGHTVTSGIIDDAARYHFGVIKDFYGKQNLHPFAPIEANAIWHFFPELYKNPNL